MHKKTDNLSPILGRRHRHMCADNRRAILDCLRRQSEPVTALEISRQIKLSRTLVMLSLYDFMREKLAKTTGKDEAATEGGPRPKLFVFNALSGFVLVSEIMPDHLYSALVDMAGNIRQSTETPLCATWTGTVVLQKIAENYRTLMAVAKTNVSKLRAIAIGAHGITDAAKGQVLVAPHFPNWETGLDIGARLRAELNADVPVHVDNLIRFMAYAALADNQYDTRERLVLLWVKDGVVAGLLDGNRVEHGRHNLAGEIGHMILDPAAVEPCQCGGRGCFEEKISPQRILRLVREWANRHPNAPLAKTGATTLADVLLAAAAGDALANAILEDVAQWFAVAIVNLMLTFDPQRVVIHGIYNTPSGLVIPKIRAAVARHPLMRHTQDSLVIESSPFSAKHSVIGAARYAINQHFA